MKTIFNWLLYLIFGTIRPRITQTITSMGGRIVPVIVIRWKEGWGHKPSVVYVDPITLVVMLSKLDTALKNWDKRSQILLEFKTTGLASVPIPANFVMYVHKALAKEVEIIMQAMDDYDERVKAAPPEIRERIQEMQHPRDALKNMVLVEEGVVDPSAVVVTNAPNTLQ